MDYFLLKQDARYTTKDDYLVDGKPALTTESMMFTKCGGIITFKSSGQND